MKSGDVVMSKKLYRKEMIHTLKSIDNDKRAQEEEVQMDSLIDFVLEKGYKSVGLIISMPHEINTDKAINVLNEHGVNVYSPACDYATKTMHFYRMHNSEDKKQDEKGIPVPNNLKKSFDEMELVVVPGLIFSETGYRIGYGGGYYDKFLADFKGDTISIVFEEQLKNEIPIESHDIPVDAIITPKRRISSKELRRDE